MSRFFLMWETTFSVIGSMAIISKQDFYVYFGVLLLVDRCIDTIIHKE